jgi:uncharacterized membrane protein
MNDRMRISDSDRDRAAARLREHYAEGRLTAEELDERITAALNARTVGDLRRVMADLPDPSLAQPNPAMPNAAPWALRRRGPRLLPLVLVMLFAGLLLPGGWVVFAFLKLILVFWLVVVLAGIIAAASFRRRVRRALRARGNPLDGPAWRDGSAWRG